MRVRCGGVARVERVGLGDVGVIRMYLRVGTSVVSTDVVVF